MDCVLSVMNKIGLIDYGSGNFTSVCNALEYLRLDICEIREPGQMDCATHLILPGVGAFPSVMEKLTRLQMIDELRRQVIDKNKPFLGICVGMQILVDVGYELQKSKGLGLITGSVERIDFGKTSLRVPHMGWNELNVLRTSELFKNIGETPSFYFVHSYHLLPKDQSVITAVCDYETKIVTSVQKENIFGVQFHPEKSQRQGLLLLKNFCNL